MDLTAVHKWDHGGGSPFWLLSATWVTLVHSAESQLSYSTNSLSGPLADTLEATPHASVRSQNGEMPGASFMLKEKDVAEGCEKAHMICTPRRVGIVLRTESGKGTALWSAAYSCSLLLAPGSKPLERLELCFIEKTSSKKTVNGVCW